MIQQALAAAKEAAHRAGEVILSYYSSSYEVQSKGVDNPVTTADLAANRVLHETLLAAFPEAGWLSEESADDAARLQHDYVWIIDPIDGTKEFIQGLDEFVVVVAFVVQHQVEVAVTYNPVRRELFHACRGQGAFCNEQPIHVSATSHLPGAEVRRGRFLRRATRDDDESERGSLHPRAYTRSSPINAARSRSSNAPRTGRRSRPVADRDGAR